MTTRASYRGQLQVVPIASSPRPLMKYVRTPAFAVADECMCAVAARRRREVTSKLSVMVYQGIYQPIEPSGARCRLCASEA